MNLNPTKKVLIADSNTIQIDELATFFTKEGFAVTTSQDGNEVIAQAKTFLPDVILLEVALPNIDGIELCYELRKIPELAHTVIVFISDKNEDFIQIAALEAGADDYLLKPIRARLLFSHIKAIVRRLPMIKEESPPEEKTQTSDFHSIIDIDKSKKCAIAQGREIILPRKEFEILSLLLSKRGRVFSRKEILMHVWGADILANDLGINVHIRKLRKRIGEDLIITHKGLGYKVKS
jgi:two-component system alkaline phosphatase synthesis response regulator PhoP